MRDLNDIRSDINKVDEEMRELFTSRMKLAAEVAEYKSAHGLAIHDPARENQVIERNAKELGDEKLRPYYVNFLQSNMEISKSYQDMLILRLESVRRSNMEIKRIINVKLGDRGYDITVGKDLLRSADKYMKLDRKVAIITDSGVPAVYAKTVANLCKEAKIITFPAGEENKNINTYAYICERLLEFNLGRSDAIVAVGGGVCGDMAGFAAATYMRGVDFYNIPTTLLSQVDSSIGGKTAIDFSGVKNIIGAFYQPKAVLIDTAALSTLDKRQFSAGLAEVVKMALTSDAELFESLENGAWREDIAEVITRALLIKKDVVEKDERESGLRRILNFGHTFGHGIEALGGLYHGECVALGMIPMCSPEIRARLIELLREMELPTEFGGELERAFEFMKHDKKCDGDMTYAIFVDKPGSFRIEKMPNFALVEHIKSQL